MNTLKLGHKLKDQDTKFNNRGRFILANCNWKMNHQDKLENLGLLTSLTL